jgi:GNAT superfamily N-acetyltransferase
VTDLAVRAARPADLPRIIELVGGMFCDLGVADPALGWTDEVTRAFNARLGDDIAAFITVHHSHAVAVAVGVIDQRLPSPRRLTGRIGYVEWLATDPRHRRRGAARLALRELLNWFDDLGVEAVDVHASRDASPLYGELGFVAPHATPLRRRQAEPAPKP